MGEDTSALADYISVPLPNKPRLAPWVTLVDLGDNRMQLRGAEYSFTLKHPVFIETFQSIHSLLDGQRTVEEIISSRDPKFLPTTITFLLKMLRANGALQEGIVSPPPPLTLDYLKENESQIQFLSHFVLDPVAALAQLHQARITLMGSDSIKNRIQQGLVGMGFGSLSEIEGLNKETLDDSSSRRKEVIEHLKSVDFLIACQDSTNYRFFEAINAACLESQTRWMHVSIAGTKGIMGPTVVPRQSACYACYDKRVASHSSELESHLAYQVDNHSSKNEGFLNPLWSTLAEQAALEVARIVSGFAPPKTIGRLYEFETTTPLVNGHDVLRLPRCPSCNAGNPRREAWDITCLNEIPMDE